MPPKVKFGREDIIKASLEIAESGGFEAINARAVAAKLGCSTQPLFREFESMDMIKREVLKRAFDIYADCIKRQSENAELPYLASGMAYIAFAQEHAELFKLLFMCNRESKNSIFDIVDPSLDYVIDLVVERTGYSREQASRFNALIWIYAHGLATMIATKYVSFDKKTIRELLSYQFQAIRLLFDADERKDVLPK